MIAFEIFINGQKRLTVGGEEYASLNALVGLYQLPLPKPDHTAVTLATSGISADQVHVGLWPSFELVLGDCVEIRVVDVTDVDAPEYVQALEEGDANVNA